MSERKAWIAGCAGKRLTADEKAFFADERPWGFILFGRNIGEAEELRDLIAELKEAGGREATPVLVDQEGGRVQRLRPPLAPRYPAAAALGELYRTDSRAAERAAWLTGRLFAFDLAAYGFTCDCLPCLDIAVTGATSAIGDRAYSSSFETIATLGRAAANGLAAGGLLPVMKHIPGHGRAKVDSHLSLPVVEAPCAELEASDFQPFRTLRDLPAGMTAHIVYEDIDRENPTTLSPIVIADVIRGRIGFNGLLDPDVVCIGLPKTDAEGEDFEELLIDAVGGAIDSIPRQRRKDDDMVREAARRAARAAAYNAWGKKPLITVFLVRV